MSGANKKAQQEEQHIRTLGLECMVSIMQSLEASAGLQHMAPPHHGQGLSPASPSDRRPGHDSSEGNFSALDEEDIVSPHADKINNNIVDVFDKKQKLSEELETGILKFNISPKTGLTYLAKAGHIEMTPKSVVRDAYTF